ncbi:hypothetical protein VTJ49DRAFT_7457 [Mycothermus thermophilus]|uniref:Uncharacterized protein n=1 Tax=Humicola insolens TaxID=85995 RepID=A0ABR3VGT1_HUMIN
MVFSLFQCVDIIFAEPGDPRIAHVNETNCFNSTDIGIADIYTLTLRAPGEGAVRTSGAAPLARYAGYLLPVVLGAAMWALIPIWAALLCLLCFPFRSP